MYLLIRWAGNANPALHAVPADRHVVQELAEMPPSLWQSIGTGGVSNPWRRISGQPALTGPHAHPEFFYVGGEFCEFCATERWAIIIALSRFGTFDGLRQLRSYDEQLATFSFTQSRYTSSFVDFVPIEHVGNTKDVWGQFVPLQSFQGNQQQLFERYDSTTYLPMSQGLPFIDLGNQFLLGGGSNPALLQNAAHQALSWQQVGQAVLTPASAIAQDLVGTANYLTAAICVVTYQQPGSVCESPLIQHLEVALG
jgi:hypothetical protein